VAETVLTVFGFAHNGGKVAFAARGQIPPAWGSFRIHPFCLQLLPKKVRPLRERNSDYFFLARVKTKASLETNKHLK
jgi:hypothetical protein